MFIFFNHPTSTTTSSQIGKITMFFFFFFPTMWHKDPAIPGRGQMTFFRVAVPMRHLWKGKKKVLQKMWELYSWVWLNIGLFRLFQKLASHVCVIFFFFSLSLFGILFSVLFWAPQHSSFIPFVSRRRTSSWKASPASIATMPLIDQNWWTWDSEIAKFWDLINLAVMVRRGDW